jgi:hypothetical protein
MRTAINSVDYVVPIEGFSQMISIPSDRRLVVLSGLTARTFGGEIVGVGNMAVQTEQIMKNLKPSQPFGNRYVTEHLIMIYGDLLKVWKLVCQHHIQK